MKRNLEDIWNKWKARIRTFVCSLTILCMLTYWFFKARPHIFACCMLVLYFLLLVLAGSTSAKTAIPDMQCRTYSSNTPTAIYLAKDGDMVLVYLQGYNENAAVNICLSPIAKAGILQRPSTAPLAPVCLRRTKNDLSITDFS